MRITGGLARGRILMSPKGVNIRPTSDKVREAIFNIIGQDLSGMRVLDLFAGTGSLGIESLSRGAANVVFVDGSAQSISLIKRNLALCGFRDCWTVIRRDLKRGFPGRESVRVKRYDLVFLDPPYGKGLLPVLLDGFSSGYILSPGARVVAELSKGETLPDSFGNLEMLGSRIYGDTILNIYEYTCRYKVGKDIGLN